MTKEQMAVICPIIAALAVGNLLADQPERDKAKGELPPAELAIYDSDPSHLWNRVHRAFFARPDAGTKGLDADTVDPPLWANTSGFLRTGASHEAAVAVLNEFLANDGHTLIADPLKRAVLQHDLWAIFDWSAQSATLKSKDGSTQKNLTELRMLLARAIGKLSLSRKQIDALPDNLADAESAGTYPAVYDPEHPRAPFLPSNLIDPKGPWICVRGAMDGPSAPVHAQYYKGRSPFLVFLQLPGGREATLQYIDDLNRATRQITKGDKKVLPQFPVGTKTALLRQMTVVDDTGEIQVTPLVQTLQMRVYRQIGSESTDHENLQAAVKFRMKRGNLFVDGHGGLVPIDWSEPLRVSLLQQNDLYDRATGASGIRTTMESCIACHSCGGGGTIHSVFTYKQDDWVPGANLMAPNRLRLVVTDASAESKRTLSWKQKRYDWGLLKGLLDSHLLSANSGDE